MNQLLIARGKKRKRSTEKADRKESFVDKLKVKRFLKSRVENDGDSSATAEGELRVPASNDVRVV